MLSGYAHDVGDEVWSLPALRRRPPAQDWNTHFLGTLASATRDGELKCNSKGESPHSVSVLCFDRIGNVRFPPFPAATDYEPLRKFGQSLSSIVAQMRWRVLFPLLLLAGSAGSASPTDILAHGRAGEMLCANPDVATKTCTNIDSYAVHGKGTLTNTGEVLFAPGQPVTLETTSLVSIENGAVCGVMQLTDLEAGKVRVNGELLPDDRNAAAVAKIVEKLKPLAGHKVCEVLRVEDGKLMKYGRMEGVDMPMPGEPVAWITSEEDYRVAPH